MKVTAAIFTFIFNVVIGIGVGFFLLVAMNGYNESDATYGLGAYALTAALVSLTMTLSAFMLMGKLVAKQMNLLICFLISVTLFSVVGAALKVLCAGIGIAIAELVRTAF